jgi:Omptin family
MHRRFLVRSAFAAALNVAAMAPAMSSDRSESPDAWWSALDASLPADVAVERATKAAGNQPPSRDTWPPDLWRPPPATWQPPPVPPIPQWEAEFGGRYWFSSGRTQFDLYDTTGTVALSRLTYTDLQAHSGEGFGRVEHLSGFFIKGYAGGGVITTGNLQDEDFPPVYIQTSNGLLATPYSSTNSEQRDGRLAYATIDAGWTWRGDTSKLGFFAGYNYFHQLVNGFGCIQTASNPYICNPTIPTSVLAITDEWNWNAVRLGFNGQWRFWGGFAFDLDFAWLPHAWLNASDTHWLRVPSFTVPEGGGSSFSSVQIDALLRYKFVNGLALGIGARYWKLDTGFAQAFFNESSLGGLPQVISLHSERWGPFIQASYKFGELRPSRY